MVVAVAVVAAVGGVVVAIVVVAVVAVAFRVQGTMYPSPSSQLTLNQSCARIPESYMLQNL